MKVERESPSLLLCAGAVLDTVRVKEVNLERRGEQGGRHGAVSP